MFGIFSRCEATFAKRPAFDGKTFASIEAAVEAIPDVVYWSRDDDGHEAADVFTGTGALYIVERA